jgi:hypothetical protein
MTLHHEPDGYAVNMGWCVRDAGGSEVYRGPEWAARLRHRDPRVIVTDALRQAQVPAKSPV